MRDNLEPAFPLAAFSPMGDQIYQDGLTKREYFAAMAMQGLLSNEDKGPDIIAGWAVSYADALIEELRK